jgi:hypothetical protein
LIGDLLAIRYFLYIWIDKKIWQSVNTKKGDVVSSARWNELFNLLIVQGDDTSATLRDALDMLYETVLSDEGADHLMIDGMTIKEYIDIKTYPGWSINLGEITLFVGDVDPQTFVTVGINDIWIDTTPEVV